jgi:hypothetical protein
MRRELTKPLARVLRLHTRARRFAFANVHFRDVRYWHIADVPLVLTNVCFWGQSGH